MLSKLINLTLLCSVVIAQSTTVQVFDAAISDMITNEDAPDSLKNICAKWFGTTFYPAPSSPCGIKTYPSSSNLSPLIQQILNDKRIIFGANSITNEPKRFNATVAGTRNGYTYYKLIGYEADIAQSIANRIATQYNVAGGIQAYFALTSWYNSATDNIIFNFYKTPYEYDAIISGMTITATWDQYGNGSAINRTSLVDFSCPYQDSADSVVKGLKPLPPGLTVVNKPLDLNYTGVIFCVQNGTDLETYTLEYFSAATPYPSPDIKGDTLKQICNAYISPIINALYDAQTSDGNLTYVGALTPDRKSVV